MDGFFDFLVFAGTVPVQIDHAAARIGNPVSEVPRFESTAPRQTPAQKHIFSIPLIPDLRYMGVWSSRHRRAGKIFQIPRR
jgi:hypothetical protein